MSSRRYREYAEEQTAFDLSLFPGEVRAYVLSGCRSIDRLRLKDRVDWGNVDLVARRCVKKTMKKFDISSNEANELLQNTYLENFEYAEVEEDL